MYVFLISRQIFQNLTFMDYSLKWLNHNLFLYLLQKEDYLDNFNFETQFRVQISINFYARWIYDNYEWHLNTKMISWQKKIIGMGLNIFRKFNFRFKYIRKFIFQDYLQWVSISCTNPFFQMWGKIIALWTTWKTTTETSFVKN